MAAPVCWEKNTETYAFLVVLDISGFSRDLHPDQLLAHRHRFFEAVAATRLFAAAQDLRLLDLQVSSPTAYIHEIGTFRPEAIGFSLNYLANVPEVVELAKATKARLPQSCIFVGGHSASFIPHELLQHAQGAIDCVVRAEGEISTPQLLDAIADGAVETGPGVATLAGTGPPT